ncbi:formate/nitrite transporter family protein [Bradyrhizobium sp.]|uniref:formate/nitrite transporter family protein n=1 Tax=Bradyrhizobium sp. TaxID=376 RepID=UPI001EB17AB0|nr:formate/nitrite transporter family protein [Bradyrhizobium sp.]MBV8922677.1 formate/nitrite transporter family protein [Bradyrhizobium sp.]MBV9981118.1 formate/nitrite transporter family protein [Bradyrhizobium sp.]
MDKPTDSDSFNPASELDGMSARQTKEIESQSRPSAALIHETIRAEGEQELRRHWWAILMSGLAAGLSIGLSLIVQGEFHAAIVDEATRRLVAPLGYTVGFLVVVLGRQQLFTENTLTPILPLLHHRDLGILAKVLKLWALVLASNIVGTWAFGSALAHTGIFDARTMAAFLDLSRHTIEGSFSSTFVRAVFAGWLIALMMWLLPATKGSRVHIIVIMTYVIALGEFSHIIAGSTECAFLVQSGNASLHQYASSFFLPTLLGNIAGGTTLVALLNYGQVAAELDKPEE